MNSYSQKKIDSNQTSQNNDVQKSGLLKVLKNKRFRSLWIGQIFSQLADKFYIVLMVYLIAQYWVSIDSQSNDAILGVATAMRMNFETRAQKITLLATGIYIANTIPAILIGTIAGIIADRFPKTLIMVISNTLRALLAMLVPFCLIPGPSWLGLSWGYWAILIMTFIESLLTQFFAPAEQSAIPLLIKKDNLLAANSLYQTTSMGATIVGFALGEPVLRIFKIILNMFNIQGGEFFLLPCCYGIAAITIRTIHLKENFNFKKQPNLRNEFKESLQILKEKPTIRIAILNLVILYSLLAALYVLTITLASSIPSLGPTRFGALLATSGIGVAIGALLIAQLGNSLNKKVLPTIGLGSITICLILLGQAKGDLTFTLIICCFLGISAALVAIPAQTTLQEDTPEDQRGKVFGLQNNLVNISLSLPLVVAGALVSRFGLIAVLWLLALLALFAAFLERPWKRC